MNKKKLDRNAESELHQCNVKAHYKNLKFWSQNLCSVAFGVDCIAHNIESMRAYLYNIHIHAHNECIKYRWNDSLTKNSTNRDWLTISIRAVDGIVRAIYEYATKENWWMFREKMQSAKWCSFAIAIAIINSINQIPFQFGTYFFFADENHKLLHYIFCLLYIKIRNANGFTNFPAPAK